MKEEEEDKMMRRLRSRARFEYREQNWVSSTGGGNCLRPVGSVEIEELGRGRRGGGEKEKMRRRRAISEDTDALETGRKWRK